jgi:tRNA threonylcarbamoyladenosine biosynthesis protein TsaE
MIYNSKSIGQTQDIASALVGKVLKDSSKKATVIALEGELGAGKTTFVQGFGKAIGVKEKIKSPTFMIQKKFEILISKSETNPKLKIHKYKTLYHIDCYRLIDHKDLLPLGIEEILNNSQNIVLIEWSERVQEILPKDHTTVHIDHVGENERKIKIT